MCVGLNSMLELKMERHDNVKDMLMGSSCLDLWSVHSFSRRPI